MKNSSNYNGTSDRNPDKRWVAWGIVGCLALIVIFFFLSRGMMGTNPATDDSQQTSNSTPSTQSLSTGSQPVGSPLNIKITEAKKAAAKADDKKKADGDSATGIQKDPDGLTVTLDPKTSTQAGSPDSATQGNSTEPDTTSAPAATAKHAPGSEAGVSESAPAQAVSHRSSGSLYIVQTGTFKNKTTADEMVSDLDNKGYSAEVKPVQVEDNTLYRVQIGEYRSRREADAICGKLKSDGYQASISGAKS